jgi:hypothetical protein
MIMKIESKIAARLVSLALIGAALRGPQAFADLPDFRQRAQQRVAKLLAIGLGST